MTSIPVVTIFVRHSANCSQKHNAFFKKCNCRKHLRWYADGKQQRAEAGTRSWSEAESIKRRLEDQLSGNVVPAVLAPSAPAPTTKSIEDAITAFLDEKKVRNVSKAVLGSYTLELKRLETHCGGMGVTAVQDITRELLTGFCATWPSFYASSYTRFRVRERLQGFIKFCFDNEWMRRKLPLPQMTIDEPPTMPLTADEFDRLLVGASSLKAERDQARCRNLILLMRWTGLSIRDALTLERAEIHHDETKGMYRVVTERQKTGTHVSVPLHPEIAEAILSTPNDDPEHIFWNNKTDGGSFSNGFYTRFVSKAFKSAGIVSQGNMVSHRLRDTFAVDLLEKGIPMEEVSKMLGHESIKTTEKHYAKWVKGRQDRLDTLVKDTWAA